MPEPYSPGLHTRRRADFPALARQWKGKVLAYLDGPAGSQMPRQVLDAMMRYYTTFNANTHGQFVTSHETDALIEEARTTLAVFLGAPSGRTISFGANMTTLAFSLSRAFSRLFAPGDEVVITELDHEANRGPWLALRDAGIVVREVEMKPDGTLDLDDMRGKVGPRTRLLAVGMASNALGTVNEIGAVREISRAVGAWLLVDAVHYAPHFPVDVLDLDVDFLLCSAYKFYGPHIGVLYCREGLLDALPVDRLRTQSPEAPARVETGTLNHAAIAGAKAAVEYIATLGDGPDLRSRCVGAMVAVGRHERELAERMYHGLVALEGVRVYGPDFSAARRAPTVSFTVDGAMPAAVSTFLAERGVCTWDGHFYAVRAIEKLGLAARGGVTRAGVLLYNTPEDVDRLLEGVRGMPG